ncbi:hypothetical protein ACFYT3_22435 [Nocardia amikacinitolerans]
MNPSATQPNPIPHREQETHMRPMKNTKSHDEDGVINPDAQLSGNA